MVGCASGGFTDIDLPTICEDETEGYFTGIETEDFAPASQTARKFILLTFMILLTAKSKPVRIDSRWCVWFVMALILGFCGRRWSFYIHRMDHGRHWRYDERNRI